METIIVKTQNLIIESNQNDPFPKVRKKRSCAKKEKKKWQIK